MIELKDIKTVFVHWSESSLINDELGADDNSDINKSVSPIELDGLIKRAANSEDLEKNCGYDKTVLTVELHNGEFYCNEDKFYLTIKTVGLLDLIK